MIQVKNSDVEKFLDFTEKRGGKALYDKLPHIDSTSNSFTRLRNTLEEWEEFKNQFIYTVDLSDLNIKGTTHHAISDDPYS